MSLVYLAGPITGLSFGNAANWREYAIKSLAENGISGLSPLRCKEYLLQEKCLQQSYDVVLSTAKGITTRDRWDCIRSDAVLVNVLGATTVSIGTMMELGWANGAGKPIILVIEKEGNIHDHAMVREVSGFIVETLDHGLEIAKALFAGEVPSQTTNLQSDVGVFQPHDAYSRQKKTEWPKLKNPYEPKGTPYSGVEK